MTRQEDEPPGWSELCARLRTAKDVAECQAILDEINRLLTAHEKAHPEPMPEKASKPESVPPAKSRRPRNDSERQPKRKN